MTGHEWGRTERLVLRRWTEAHFPFLYELGSRPEMVKYVGDGSLWDQGMATAKHEAALAHWDRHGFGWLAVHDATDSFVGVVALTVQSGETPRTVEIGYWIATEAWGLGYATEAVAAAVDRMFHSGRAERLTARYRHENGASGRLLEKLGFTTRPVAHGRRKAVLEISEYEPLRPGPRK